MQASDVVNGLFEGFAAVAVLNHCRVIYKDREVKGTSLISTVFFTSWGFWNMYYYPSLNQWFSTVCGATVCAANCFYVSLIWRFKNGKQKHEKTETANQSGA